MKVFISQPMGGRSEEEILNERDRVWRKLLKLFPFEPIEVIDTYFSDYYPVENHPGLKMLSKSLELLDKADLVYFVKDFRQARGCLIEYEVANLYGIENIIVEEDER